jgi:alpha-ketoglutarate-dependent taurine dioxygenase
LKSFILVEERSIISNMDKKEAHTPVLVDDLTDFFVQEELVNKYKSNGFVIFEVSNPTPSSELIQNLAKAINLGETYVTGYNKNKFGNMFKENRLNTITNTKKSNHVVFDNSNAQGLHSDATFEPIGTVPSTILYCEQEAFEGGDTILFDSVRAFKLLDEFNPEWAKAMLHPESLRRRSILGDTVEAIEPAFKILPNGEIISRFTVDTSSDWEYGFERVPYLREAFGFMTGLIPRGSGFSTILKLKSNQGILFANDKIAHGRTAFIDDKNAPRKMIRGLYLSRPSLTE